MFRGMLEDAEMDAAPPTGKGLYMQSHTKKNKKNKITSKLVAAIFLCCKTWSGVNVNKNDDVV